jgi:hypothetical protein
LKNGHMRVAKADCAREHACSAACILPLLAISLVALWGNSRWSHSTGKPFNVGTQAAISLSRGRLEDSLRRRLVFGPAMLLAFSWRELCE